MHVDSVSFGENTALEKAGEPAVKEWNFNPDEILSSPRKVKGIFHQPVVDKDGEIINSKGMRDAVPDFMHLPALHDFHKERPVGLATKVQELGGGRFYMEGVIKATHDCDDVWEKVKTGNYGQMSIFGKRTKYNNQCALPQSMRSGPCVTDGVRLDSISICDENARNPQTSLEMMKAKVVFDADELRKADIEKGARDRIVFSSRDPTKDPNTKPRVLQTTVENKKTYQVRSFRAEGNRKYPKDDWDPAGKPYSKNDEKKAETAGESSLMHTSTDYAGGKVKITKCPRCNKPKENPVTTISKEDEVGKAAAHMGKRVDPNLVHDTRAIARRLKDGTEIGEGVRQQTNSDIEAGMKLHKAEDNEPSAPEETATKYKPFKGKTKELPRHPFTETGSAHPKRSKEGYPLVEGPNVPPKSKRPAGAKGTAPKPENFTERNEKVEELKRKSAERGSIILEHAKEKKQEDGPKRKLYRVGAPIKSIRAKVQKADDMEDDVEKGTRPTVTEEPLAKKSPKKSPYPKFESQGEGRRGEQFDKAAADDLADDDYDEDEDKEFKHLKPSDKEGNWNKSKNPNGTPGLKKAKKQGYKGEEEEQEEADWKEFEEEAKERKMKKAKADKGPDEEDEERLEEEEEAEEEEEEEVEKGKYSLSEPRHQREAVEAGGAGRRLHEAEMEAEEAKNPSYSGSWEKTKRAQAATAHAVEVGKKRAERDLDSPAARRSTSARGVIGLGKMTEGTMRKGGKGDEDASSELFDPSTVTKGEHMVDETETEQDVEYVTKALVPIEEIDTIVKARTEEISKAYMSQLDEITKAYDEKVGLLAARIEKMENETIRKGGSVVVIQELLDNGGVGAKSNADAVAQMQAGRR